MQTKSVLNFTKVGLDLKKKELAVMDYVQVQKDENQLLEKEYITNESSIPSSAGDDFAGFQIIWRK